MILVVLEIGGGWIDGFGYGASRGANASRRSPRCKTKKQLRRRNCHKYVSFLPERNLAIFVVLIPLKLRT